MGYYIFSYGINTEEIKAVFGCRDQQIAERIRQNSMYDHFCDFEPEGYVATSPVALHDIIMGKSRRNKTSHAYVYALICICSTLGDTLPFKHEIKLGYETDFMNSCLNKYFGINDLQIEEELLASHSIPFDIPAPTEYPLMGMVNGNRLKKLRERLKGIQITSEEIRALEDSGKDAQEEKGFALHNIKGVMDNIDYCIENELDLISFCH